VLDDDCQPEPAVGQYLAHLAAREHSPNTVRAYTTSLKLWFEFLAQIDVGWAEAGVDDVVRFVSWLRARLRM
jgi:site-specific recombinase XerD